MEDSQPKRRGRLRKDEDHAQSASFLELPTERADQKGPRNAQVSDSSLRGGGQRGISQESHNPPAAEKRPTRNASIVASKVIKEATSTHHRRPKEERNSDPALTPKTLPIELKANFKPEQVKSVKGSRNSLMTYRDRGFLMVFGFKAKGFLSSLTHDPPSASANADAGTVMNGEAIKSFQESNDTQATNATPNLSPESIKPTSGRSWTSAQREAYEKRRLQKEQRKAAVSSRGSRRTQTIEEGNELAAEYTRETPAQDSNLGHRQSPRHETDIHSLGDSHSQENRPSLDHSPGNEKLLANDPLFGTPADLSVSNLRRLNEELDLPQSDIPDPEDHQHLSQDRNPAPKSSERASKSSASSQGNKRSNAEIEHDHGTGVRDQHQSKRRHLSQHPESTWRSVVARVIQGPASPFSTPGEIAEGLARRGSAPADLKSAQFSTEASKSGLCPLCKEDLTNLDVNDFRGHVERCLDGSGHNDPATSVQAKNDDTRSMPDLSSEGRIAPQQRSNLTAHLLEVYSTYRSASSEEDEESDAIYDEEFASPYESGVNTPDEDASVSALDDQTPFRKLAEADKFVELLERAKVKPTPVLYGVIQHAQSVLRVWQDEWIELESQVALEMARKPVDPRPLGDPRVFEDQKEATLYGYRWDKNPDKIGMQDPIAQRTGRTVGGKQLRRRLPNSKPDDVGDLEGGRRGRPRRNAGGVAMEQNGVIDLQNTATTTRLRKPPKKLAYGEGNNTTELPKRRGRPKLSAIPSRVRDLRDGLPPSATTTDAEGSPAPKRRGRPPKNPASIARANAALNPTTASLVEARKRGRKPKVDVETADGNASDSKKKPKSETRSTAMVQWWAKRKEILEGALKTTDSPTLEQSEPNPRAKDLEDQGDDSIGVTPATSNAPSPAANGSRGPKRKGRPPGAKSKRGGKLGMKSERLVDSAADESDVAAPIFGIDGAGDGPSLSHSSSVQQQYRAAETMAEWDHYQKIERGFLHDTLGRGRRRGGMPMGAEEEGRMETPEVEMADADEGGSGEEEEEDEDEVGEEADEDSWDGL